ncbi:hypothetical protein J6I90_09945 [Pseudidiomarina sp. 1APP75-32.1]|uniref:Uncharacterized protein n=1 Tax=Pseudidiomarina terrestris TaxID=2820060 RepID=A0AAW7R0E4_9GAMM|nr:hypothetical protein [Pseudidiomarina sp. 1APP75-32.1]MDN7125202.1 hypothetical protein [Pseudidiomarina sp. 1APP75-32.1]
MSDFHLITTLSSARTEFPVDNDVVSPDAEKVKKLNRLRRHKEKQKKVEPFSKLAELMAPIIKPCHQKLTLGDNTLIQELKVSHNYWHTHMNHGCSPTDGFDQAFEIDYLPNMRVPVEKWKYAEFYPPVRRNKWYRDPSKNVSGEIYLSWGQLAHLIIDESVNLRELVLNDDDRQFEHLLSVQLLTPFTLQWKHLTSKTQARLLTLALPFLSRFYRYTLRKRLYHMRHEQVPDGKLDSIVATKSNLAHRITCIEPLLVEDLSRHQKIKVCALYFSMLPNTAGPDLFLLDVLSQIVKLNRLVTNEELLVLARSAINSDRNKRILDYSHSEFLTSGIRELKTGKIRWNRDEDEGALAKRYRERCIVKLLKSNTKPNLYRERKPQNQRFNQTEQVPVKS